jgi:hypothetical protein
MHKRAVSWCYHCLWCKRKAASAFHNRKHHANKNAGALTETHNSRLRPLISANDKGRYSWTVLQQAKAVCRSHHKIFRRKRECKSFSTGGRSRDATQNSNKNELLKNKMHACTHVAIVFTLAPANIRTRQASMLDFKRKRKSSALMSSSCLSQWRRRCRMRTEAIKHSENASKQLTWR